MASFIYWKLRSHLSYSTVTFDGHFVSVGEAKRLISSKINLPAEELVLTNASAQTEYQDDSEQIPKGTSITVRRVPGGALKRRPIVNIQQAQQPKESTAPAPKPAQQEDDFGSDPLLQQAEALKAQEEAARRAAVLATQTHQTGTALPLRGQPGQAGGRGTRARPYMTYVCPRCSAVGKHWESECPTQGDPAYDVRRVRAPAGMPTSKIVANPDGDFILPDGTLGQIQTDVSTYQKQAAMMMGGIPEPEENQASMLALEGPSTMLALPAPQQPSSQQIPSQQQQPSLPARTATPVPPSSQQPQPIASVAQSSKGQPPHTPPRVQPQELTSQPSPQPTQQSPLEPTQPQQQKQPQAGGGLFDDDDDVLQAAAQPVKLAASGVQGSTAVPALSGGSRASPLGPGAVKPSQQEPSTDSCSEGIVAVGRAGRKAATSGRVSNMSGLPELDDEDMIQLERQSIPAELKKVVFATPRDFMDHMDSLQGWGLLPKADPKIWLLAFGSGLPLTPTEFKQLKARYGRKPQTEEHTKHKDRGRAKDSDTRDRRRSTSREDRRRHHQHHRSSRHRSRSVTRSRSRSRSHLRTKRDRQPTSPGRWVPSSPSFLSDEKHIQLPVKEPASHKGREGAASKTAVQEDTKVHSRSNAHVSKDKKPSRKVREQDDKQEEQEARQQEAAQAFIKTKKQDEGTNQQHEDLKEEERSPEVEQPVKLPSDDLEPQQSISGNEVNGKTDGEHDNGSKAMDQDDIAPSDSLSSHQQDAEDVDEVMANAEQPIQENLLDVSPAVEEQRDDDSSKKQKKKHKKSKKHKSGDKDKEKKRKKKDEKSDKSGKRRRASDSGKVDEPPSKRSSRQASSASDSDFDNDSRRPAKRLLEHQRDNKLAAGKAEPEPKSKLAVSAKASQPEATDKAEKKADDKPARPKRHLDWDTVEQKRAGRLLAGMLGKTTLDSRKRKPSGELPDTSNTQRSRAQTRDDDAAEGGRWKHDKFRD